LLFSKDSEKGAAGWTVNFHPIESHITISALAKSEPEDPLELIEEHKGADVTLRE
ncbi:hypothetical protein KUCAC02_002757, partial [Chaenocephalus aceratus]